MVVFFHCFNLFFLKKQTEEGQGGQRGEVIGMAGMYRGIISQELAPNELLLSSLLLIFVSLV